MCKIKVKNLYRSVNNKHVRSCHFYFTVSSQIGLHQHAHVFRGRQRQSYWIFQVSSKFKQDETGVEL